MSVTTRCLKNLTWSTFNLLPSCPFSTTNYHDLYRSTILPSPCVLSSLLVSDVSHYPLCRFLTSGPFAIIRSYKTTSDSPSKRKVALNPEVLSAKHETEELASEHVAKC